MEVKRVVVRNEHYFKFTNSNQEYAYLEDNVTYYAISDVLFVIGAHELEPDAILPEKCLVAPDIYGFVVVLLQPKEEKYHIHKNEVARTRFELPDQKVEHVHITNQPNTIVEGECELKEENDFGTDILSTRLDHKFTVMENYVWIDQIRN
jgi:hypothetical protein